MEYGYQDGLDQIALGWGCPLETPIQNIGNGFGSELMGYINYFIPIGEMAAILAVWVIAIGAYYLASIVMRWVKAIS